jgi:hypothetical protein
MRTSLVRFLTPALILAPVLGAGAGFAMAQDPAGRDAVVKRFEATAPKIGAPVPDVSLVDAKGKVHSLRDLAGEHYTVLVLGCLT